MSHYAVIFQHGDGEDSWSIDGEIPGVGDAIHVNDNGPMRVFIVERRRFDVGPSTSGMRGAAPYLFVREVRP